jgi:prepilin-type N-terminal cleavage/methylation domain-containing protein
MSRTQLTQQSIDSRKLCVRDRRSQHGRRATGGFTLIELIVAMTISLIIIGIATTILLSGTNMAQRTAQRALEEQIVDGVFNFAKDRLLYAGTVEAESDLGTVGSGRGLLYVSNESGAVAEDPGMLFFRDVSDPVDTAAALNVMGKDFYMGYTISLEAKLTSRVDEKPIVSIKVNLHSKTNPDQVVAKRERTFTLINGATFKGTENSETIVTPPQFLSFGPAASPTS